MYCLVSMIPTFGRDMNGNLMPCFKISMFGRGKKGNVILDDIQPIIIFAD